MKPRPFLLLLAAGLVLGGCSTPPPANGVSGSAITVSFQDPDHFRDVRESPNGFTDRNALDALRDFLKQAAPARLQPGQTLGITFTDIDLAGDFEPGTTLERARLIKAIYSPRIKLTFELRDASGKILKQGDRVLTDLNFQMAANRIGQDQPYFYDKELLRSWLQSEFK